MTSVNNTDIQPKHIRSFLCRLRSVDTTPLLLCWAAAVFYFFFCYFLGLDPIGRSGYCTYTLQAMAWRNGQASLGRDYEWLELAIYNGDWYVSFPPVPSIPLFFLSFLFGSETPDHLLVKLYVLCGCLAIYHLLRHAGYGKAASLLHALFCSYASCLLSLTTDGAVWFQAQTLAFCLTCMSLLMMLNNKVTLSLLLYAFSVGCRPFNVLFGPVLLSVYLMHCHENKICVRGIVAKAAPGIFLGLGVAFVYAWYNWYRFGNPFEFGHNYLPEFSWQGGVQFSLSHIAANVRTFILGLPFHRENGTWSLSLFGFSFLAACPVFLVMIIRFLRDILRKKLSVSAGILMGCFAVHLLLLLTHRTFGGYQFGARYTCDLLPYAALYPIVSDSKWKFTLPDALLFIFSVCFSIYGAAVVLL